MSTKKTMITGEFRVAFASVFTPKERNGKEKYEITMLFNSNPKDLKEAAVKVLKDSFPEDKLEKAKSKNKISLPFVDGNTKDLDNYPFFADTVVCPAGTIFKPGLINSSREAILDPEDFYNGCYARAQVSFYPWEFQGKLGVSLNILNIQKLKDGERLGGGRVKAEDVFSSIEDDENDSEEDDDVDW